MAGIVSYGAYIPIFRLSRKEIARAWNEGDSPGEKAVANYDEDSITMSVEAVIDCLSGMERDVVDGVYFASTTSPYKEKLAASLIATAIDIPRQIVTGDFADSLRAGTTAMKAAIDAVNGGSAKKFMVTAADCRMGTPHSDYEPLFGDGAAAFLMGNDGVIASIEGSYTHTDEFTDNWRLNSDQFVKTWEDRFILEHGYRDNIIEAISAVLKKYNLKAQDISKVVYYAPDARRHTEIARKFGFDPKTQVQDPMFDRLGNAGCAFAMIMLVAALEEAKPGDRILFVNYGDGADAYIFQVTDEIKKLKPRRGVKKHLESKMMLPSYEKYISNRRLMSIEAQRREPLTTFLPLQWREQNRLIRLHASKCRQCGRLFFPMQRVCLYCQAKDDYDEVRLSDKKGYLFTYSKDSLAVSMDPPTVLSVVNIDIDGGVRFYSQMTDRDPDEIVPEMPVEMTFRMIHDMQGVRNYFWKCRPIRVE